VDYRRIPAGGGTPVPARLIDIAWLDGDRQLDLAIAGPRDRMDAPAIKQIIASLRREAPG
jgi:hypothetical protein